MLIGGFMLLAAMFAFLFVPLVLLVFALVDLVQRSDAEWSTAGQDRMTWLLVTLFVGVVGPVLYLVVARPKLDQARRRLATPSVTPVVAPPGDSGPHPLPGASR